MKHRPQELSTNLTATTLHGTDLRGVDLSQVIGLDKAQIEEALTDQMTRLPDYLESFNANSSAHASPGNSL